MMLDALLTVGGKLIDKLIPDPEAKAKAQLDLATLAQNGELAQMANDTKLFEVEDGSEVDSFSLKSNPPVNADRATIDLQDNIPRHEQTGSGCPVSNMGDLHTTTALAQSVKFEGRRIAHGRLHHLKAVVRVTIVASVFHIFEKPPNHGCGDDVAGVFRLGHGLKSYSHYRTSLHHWAAAVAGVDG